MLFNSGVFLKFFGAFLLLYWLVRNDLRMRNVLVVAASYFFYGWWDYRFLSLLIGSSLLDYFVALRVAGATTPRAKRWWVASSVAGNLTILGVFKYFDFFAQSLAAASHSLGWPIELPLLQVVLPVGISFYTFQSMSYTLDVYRGQLEPTRDVVAFLAYVSFFPQLVAGPIERGAHLLPQFVTTRVITPRMVQEGVWWMLWGMFKKVALADNLAPLVELAYGQTHHTMSGVGLGTIAFAFQIYCDFSGYSDIARGLARVLGFDLRINFDLPYTATNLRSFWQRWHISLSTWLRDYLYISLGGNRRGRPRTYLNLFITMLLGGLWHGAAWHFVLWGLWHGLGLAVHRVLRDWRGKRATASPGALSKLARWIATMVFVLYGWLLFRAQSLEQIRDMTLALTEFTTPPWLGSFALNLMVFTAPVVALDFWQYRAGSDTAPLRAPRWVQAALQALLLLGIVMYWQREKMPFLYFQF